MRDVSQLTNFSLLRGHMFWCSGKFLTSGRPSVLADGGSSAKRALQYSSLNDTNVDTRPVANS